MPASRSHKCCLVQALLSSSFFQLFFSMFPAPALHPHPSQQAKDLIFNIHMGTTGVDRCHKALLSEFCPEKENCFFRLKADDYTFSLQEKLLPNFNCLLLLFVDTQSPDFSPIPLPALLATSLFPVTSSPCYTSNCLSLLSCSSTLSLPFPSLY